MLLFAAGYPVPELKVDSNMLHYRKMELIGTFGADHEDFKEAAQALSTKVVDVSKIGRREEISTKQTAGSL